MDFHIFGLNTLLTLQGKSTYPRYYYAIDNVFFKFSIVTMFFFKILKIVNVPLNDENTINNFLKNKNKKAFFKEKN
jgi:hypothetical protein